MYKARLHWYTYFRFREDFDFHFDFEQALAGFDLPLVVFVLAAPLRLRTMLGGGSVGLVADGVVTLLILFEDGDTFCCNVTFGFIFSAFC